MFWQFCSFCVPSVEVYKWQKQMEHFLKNWVENRGTENDRERDFKIIFVFLVPICSCENVIKILYKCRQNGKVMSGKTTRVHIFADVSIQFFQKELLYKLSEQIWKFKINISNKFVVEMKIR